MAYVLSFDRVKIKMKKKGASLLQSDGFYFIV